MSRDLHFDVQWMHRGTGDAPEQASFAAVRILASGLVLTEGYDAIAQTVRAEARLSVVHLGRWLAANWWRLRHEPESASLEWRLSHDLPAAGGGFLWPPLRVVSDGEAIRLTSLESARRQAMFRYRQQPAAWVPAARFERAVDELMELLLARLDALGARDDELSELWQLILAERTDPEQARLRRREALLGVEPDAIGAVELERTLEEGAWMGEAALDEVIATTSCERLAARVAAVAAWRDAGGPAVDLDPFLRVAGPARATTPDEAPWERGIRLAQTVRAGLGVGHAPLSSDTMARLLAVSPDRLSTVGGAAASGERSLALGLRDTDQPSRVCAWMRSAHPRGRRFELARIVGDAIMAPTGDVALPLTDRATARQKAQRAFAQELLCPEEALRRELPLPAPTDLDIADLADRYDVSELLIVSALQNRRLVPRGHFDSLD